MQGTIKRMNKSKTTDAAWASVRSVGFCLLLACNLSYAQAPGGQTAQTPASGPSTATNSSVVANAQQSLYTASGQNGAQSTQDSFKGSVVTGKATNGVLDLSLEDPIQRGLRQNLGLILQSSSQKNAKGHRLEALRALLPAVTAWASIQVQQIDLAAYGLKFPGLAPVIGPFQV